MKPEVIITLYVVCAVLMLCFIKLLCHVTLADNIAGHVREFQPDGMLPASELLRSLVLYSQWMLLVLTLNIEWPATVGFPLRALAAFWATSSGETLNIECLLSNGSVVPMAVQRIIFYLSMPLAMLMVLLLVEVVLHKNSLSSATASASLGDRLASTSMVVTFFFLPSVLRTVFGLFACVTLDDPVSAPFVANAVGSFWVYDLNAACFSGYHKPLSLALGLPFIVLLLLGLPAAIVYVTVSNRHRLDDPLFRKHYGFLTRQYVPHRCWWEAVMVCCTATLVAISIYGVNIGPFYQCLLMLAALLLIGKLLTSFKPHVHDQARRAMLLGVQCLLLTSLVGLSFLRYGSIQPSTTYGLVMGVVLLRVNLAYICWILWQLVKSIEFNVVVAVVRKCKWLLLSWFHAVNTSSHVHGSTAAAYHTQQAAAREEISCDMHQRANTAYTADRGIKNVSAAV